MIRNRRLVICLSAAIVALSFIPATSAEESSTTTARKPASVQLQLEKAPPMSVDPSCVSATELGTFEIAPAMGLDGIAHGEAKPGHCPISPSCSVDAQCDDYCGTPGWGACEFGCCACLG